MVGRRQTAWLWRTLLPGWRPPARAAWTVPSSAAPMPFEPTYHMQDNQTAGNDFVRGIKIWKTFTRVVERGRRLPNLPAGFKDSNGDGIGDLNGIRESWTT